MDWAILVDPDAVVTAHKLELQELHGLVQLLVPLMSRLLETVELSSDMTNGN